MSDRERIKELTEELVKLLERSDDWQLNDAVVTAVTYKDLEALDE